MAWARENGYIVFTHHLDFGTVLALTRAAGPSVIQVRAHDVLPAHLEQIVVSTLHAHEAQLLEGAIVTVDESRAKCVHCQSSLTDNEVGWRARAKASGRRAGCGA